MTPLRFRAAGPGDALPIAQLHADSWRRHYRGAFADSFLDGDLEPDRLAVWSARLAAPTDAVTIVAEDDAGLAGFTHLILDQDPQWGSFIDNLHVVHNRHRGGIGTGLLAHAARAVLARAATRSLHLWTLQQNVAAQRFYEAVGGANVEIGSVSPPGGVADRLNGHPTKFRFSWPDVTLLAALQS